MNFKVPSYEERVALIKTEEDIDRQISLAESKSKRIKTESKKQPTLEKKVQMGRLAKSASDVAHKLKLNYFVIADSLRSA